MQLSPKLPTFDHLLDLLLSCRACSSHLLLRTHEASHCCGVFGARIVLPQRADHPKVLREHILRRARHLSKPEEAGRDSRKQAYGAGLKVSGWRV